MAWPTITTAPTAPTRSMSNDEFIAAADAFVAWMATLDDQLNAWSSYAAAFGASLGVSSADAELAAIAALTSAANKGIYFTGSGTASLFDLSSFGRTLAALADAAALRSAAGVYSTSQVDALVTGLLDFKGSTDCSANPNYPAASKGDAYVVSVAGKIGGASGKSVDVGDWYLATADNAGGAEGSVGTSWTALEHNLDTTLLVPTGSIHQFAMSTPPSGYLECDGSSVLRATYPALFTAIGTTWGSVDGTHFTLPDLRGEFIRGWDHGKGTDSGRSFASSQADDFKAHTHTVPFDDVAGGGSVIENAVGTASATVNTGSTGGAETRPRNIALMYAIKT
jgi:microcystin-dependent protein